MSREDENMDGNFVSTDARVPNDDIVETTTAAEGETAAGDGKWGFSSVAAPNAQEKSFQSSLLNNNELSDFHSSSHFHFPGTYCLCSFFAFSSRQQRFGSVEEGLRG